MALTTPALYPQAAFDAANAQQFSFTVVGGNQVTANRLIIKNNSTLATVYDNKVTTYNLYQTVPANTLTNGVYYQVQIQTFDASGAASALSSPIQFHCYTTPVIAFTNMPSNNIVANSSYEFKFTYSQVENELLESYTVTLYNSTQSQISTSGVQYVGSSNVPPTNLSYEFAGFSDNTEYYISVDGITIEGTAVSTGKIEFTVDFVLPNAYALLLAENNLETGQIQLTSELVIIEGNSNPAPPTYINDTEADLSAQNSWVAWNQGFTATDDFTLTCWLRGVNANTELYTLANKDNQSIVVSSVVDSTSMYLTLSANFSASEVYFIKSNTIPIPAATEQVFVYIRRVGGLYDFSIENRGAIT